MKVKTDMIAPKRLLYYMTLLGCMVLLSACDSSADKKKALDTRGWIVCEDVNVGSEFELGKAYVRKSEAFQYEIFYKNGVVTSTADRLPDNITAAPVPEGGFRTEFPPEFQPAAKEYAIFARITPETDMEAFALALGSPLVARPVFSVDSMSGVMEYFWTLPDQYVLGVITKDSKPLEKLLIHGAIPSVWR